MDACVERACTESVWIVCNMGHANIIIHYLEQWLQNKIEKKNNGHVELFGDLIMNHYDHALELCNLLTLEERTM